MPWKHVENSNLKKPLEIDSVSSSDYVYIRKNFIEIEETEERPAHFEYDENEIPKADWELYQKLIIHEEQLTDTEIALVEIYEMLLGGGE